MKADEEVKEKLLKNFEKWKKELNEMIDYYLSSIKNAEKVEDIMFFKKRLLLYLLKYFPIDIELCYFCIMKELKRFDTCADCPYAKYHRRCPEGYSDYAIIIRHLEVLYKLIDEFYYYREGEKYEEKEEK